MVSNSPHRQWKGCPMCKSNKHRGNGDAERTPWREKRKLGIKRRYNRHQVKEDA